MKHWDWDDQRSELVSVQIRDLVRNYIRSKEAAFYNKIDDLKINEFRGYELFDFILAMIDDMVDDDETFDAMKKRIRDAMVEARNQYR